MSQMSGDDLRKFELLTMTYEFKLAFAKADFGRGSQKQFDTVMKEIKIIDNVDKWGKIKAIAVKILLTFCHLYR